MARKNWPPLRKLFEDLVLLQGSRPSRLVPDHSSTSATLSSGQSEADRHAVAEFANELFWESFSAPSIVFSESQVAAADGPPRRYHAFLRALEGVFLVRLRPSRTPTRDLHNLTLSQYLLGPTSRIGWKPISSTDC